MAGRNDEEIGNIAYIDICPKCGERMEYDILVDHMPDSCTHCHKELKGDRTPYCGDCGSEDIDWDRNGGCWYCNTCNNYPDYVEFHYE